MNKFFKAFSLGLVGAGAGIVTMMAAPAPVQSAQYCDSGAGWSACAVAGVSYDTVTFTTNGLTEDFKIRCEAKGWAYESVGHLTEAEANEFVEGYCKGRGPAHS